MREPIYLTPCMPFEKLDVCASRFWGNPALPSPDDYPFYEDENGDEIAYTFICQINLADLHAEFPENPLPSRGLLLFFGKINHYLGRYSSGYCIGGAISDADDVKVLYYPETDGFDEVVILDDDDCEISPKELEIKFSDKMSEVTMEDHALFARPDHREWETWDEPFEDWEILLQIDSFARMDFNLNFMDCGVLDFLIAQKDINLAKFDNVRAVVLST